MQAVCVNFVCISVYTQADLSKDSITSQADVCTPTQMLTQLWLQYRQICIQTNLSVCTTLVGRTNLCVNRQICVPCARICLRGYTVFRQICLCRQIFHQHTNLCDYRQITIPKQICLFLRRICLKCRQKLSINQADLSIDSITSQADGTQICLNL